MIVVGELRDRRLADEIADECQRRGIPLGISELEDGTVVLLVENEEFHYPATQIYAYMTGRGEAVPSLNGPNKQNKTSYPLEMALL